MNDQTTPPAGAATVLLAEARARFESDLAGAREAATRALEVARMEGDGGSAAEAHMVLGECHRVLGDQAASLASYGEALEAARAAGHEEWLSEHIAEELAKADSSTVDRFVTGTRRHAVRRGAEMEAATAMLTEFGVPPLMADASRAVHERIAAERD